MHRTYNELLVVFRLAMSAGKHYWLSCPVYVLSPTIKHYLEFTKTKLNLIEMVNQYYSQIYVRILTVHMSANGFLKRIVLLLILLVSIAVILRFIISVLTYSTIYKHLYYIYAYILFNYKRYNTNITFDVYIHITDTLKQSAPLKGAVSLLRRWSPMTTPANVTASWVLRERRESIVGETPFLHKQSHTYQVNDMKDTPYLKTLEKPDSWKITYRVRLSLRTVHGDGYNLEPCC